MYKASTVMGRRKVGVCVCVCVLCCVCARASVPVFVSESVSVRAPLCVCVCGIVGSVWVWDLGGSGFGIIKGDPHFSRSHRMSA